MPLFARHPLRVQPFFGHRSHDRLVLTARALRARLPRFDPGSRLRAVRTLAQQFISHEVADVPVRLELHSAAHGRVEHHGITDAEGYVRFDLPLQPAWDLPRHPVWELGRLHWYSGQGEQSAQAPVLAPGHASDLAIISDIDDTIIETGITGGLASVLRNWKRIFAQLPHERLGVPGAEAFFRQLGGGPADEAENGEADGAAGLPATRRPFFYVSSSPWNLYCYLVAYLHVRGLPLGPLMLRDWGLDRRTLGSASHGAHKGNAIEQIMAMHPQLRFALIGDDTQGDLPAFARAVARNPARIMAVFVRTVSAQAFSAEEERARAAIERTGVPLWLGRDYTTGARFLRAIGATPGGQTEQIVRAVSAQGG